MRTKPNGSGCGDRRDPEAELELLVAAEAEALAGDPAGRARPGRAPQPGRAAAPRRPGHGQEEEDADLAFRHPDLPLPGEPPALDDRGPGPAAAPDEEAGEPLAALLDRAAVRLRGHPERAVLLDRFLAGLRNPAPEAAPGPAADPPGGG